MFGGGRLQVHEPLRCGDRVRRVGRLAAVRTRLGASGPLLLVSVRHELLVGGAVRAVEEQDLVYREAGDVAPARARVQPTAPAPDHPWRLTVAPDPVLLFRFSALTASAHRIHYDRPYATQVEGHPGLVVHGPLLALLMLELPRRNTTAPVTDLSWRARRPVYDHETVELSGTPARGGAELTAGAAGSWDRVTATVHTAMA